MTASPWIDGVCWPVQSARSVLQVRKTIVGNRHEEYDRLALTMSGVIPRSKLDDAGLAPDSFAGYQVVRRDQLLFKLIDLENRATSRVGIVPSLGIVSPAYIAATCLRWLPRFGYYYFFSLYNEGVFNELGSGVRSTLGPADLLDLRVPVPSVTEQVAIVTYLDRETAQIDAFIADQEQLIGLLEERRIAAVTVSVANGSSSYSEATFPATWRMGRLRDTIASARNGIWGQEPGVSDETLRCVRVADFDRARWATQDADVSMRSFRASELEGRRLRRGDLLLEKSGGGPKSPVGMCVRWESDEDAVCSNFVARVRLAPDMDSSYWVYVHAALYAEGVTARHAKQSTGIQNLDQAGYLDERVGIPPLSTQISIASELAKETTSIDAAIADAREAIVLSKERRAALISAAVTGRIDVTERKRVLV